MNKKIIAAGLAMLLIALSFASCGKKFSGLKFVDGDGNEAVAVTDESGNLIYDEEGSVIAFAKDKDGKFVTAENGDAATTPVKPGNPQKMGDFYATDYVKLPLKMGWKINESGALQLLKKGSTAYIEIGRPSKSAGTLDAFVKTHTDVFAQAGYEFTVTDSNAVGGVYSKYVKLTPPAGAETALITEFYFFETAGGFSLITCGAENQADFDKADFAAVLKGAVIRR